MSQEQRDVSRGRQRNRDYLGLTFVWKATEQHFHVLLFVL